MGFVSLIFIQPNLLTETELGLVRILIAAAFVVSTIIPLGVSSINIKYFSFFKNKATRNDGYFAFMLLFLVAGTILSSIILFVFKEPIIYQYKRNSELFVHYFYLLLPFAFIVASIGVMNTYVGSLYKTSLVTFLDSILNKLLFILIIVIYYFHWITFDVFIYLLLGIYGIQAAILFAYVFLYDRPTFKINFHKIKSVGLSSIIKYGLSMTLAVLATTGLKFIDAVMIGNYFSLDYVAVFSVTAFIAMIIEIPLNSLERISSIQIAALWKKGDEAEINNIYKKSVKYLILIGGLLLVGIILNIRDLLTFLPEAYHHAHYVTIIASVGAFINIATGVNSAILFNSDKYIYGTFLLILLLVLTVINNIVFIPLWGIEGAAFASALSVTIYNIIKFTIIKIKFNMQPYDNNTIKILLIIFLSFVAGYFIPSFSNPIISMIVRSGIITIVYLLLTYNFRVIPEFDKYFHIISKTKNS